TFPSPTCPPPGRPRTSSKVCSGGRSGIRTQYSNRHPSRPVPPSTSRPSTSGVTAEVSPASSSTRTRYPSAIAAHGEVDGSAGAGRDRSATPLTVTRLASPCPPPDGASPPPSPPPEPGDAVSSGPVLRASASRSPRSRASGVVVAAGPSLPRRATSSPRPSSRSRRNAPSASTSRSPAASPASRRERRRDDVAGAGAGGRGSSLGGNAGLGGRAGGRAGAGRSAAGAAAAAACTVDPLVGLVPNVGGGVVGAAGRGGGGGVGGPAGARRSGAPQAGQVEAPVDTIEPQLVHRTTRVPYGPAMFRPSDPG